MLIFPFLHRHKLPKISQFIIIIATGDTKYYAFSVKLTSSPSIISTSPHILTIRVTFGSDDVSFSSKIVEEASPQSHHISPIINVTIRHFFLLSQVRSITFICGLTLHPFLLSWACRHCTYLWSPATLSWTCQHSRPHYHQRANNINFVKSWGLIIRSLIYLGEGQIHTIIHFMTCK